MNDTELFLNAADDIICNFKQASVRFEKTDGNMKIGNYDVSGIRYIKIDIENRDVLVIADKENGNQMVLCVKFDDIDEDLAKEILHKVYDHFKDYGDIPFEDYCDYLKNNLEKKSRKIFTKEINSLSLHRT